MENNAFTLMFLTPDINNKYRINAHLPKINKTIK